MTVEKCWDVSFPDGCNDLPQVSAVKKSPATGSLVQFESFFRYAHQNMACYSGITLGSKKYQKLYNNMNRIISTC